MHFIDVIYCDFLPCIFLARAVQVLGSWMVQMAMLRKSYQRDTVVDQEQLHHIWMPHGIQLDIDHWFLPLGGWQDTVVFSVLTLLVGSRSLTLMVESKT